MTDEITAKAAKALVDSLTSQAPGAFVVPPNERDLVQNQEMTFDGTFNPYLAAQAVLFAARRAE